MYRLALALPEAFGFGAALGLLEEAGDDAGEGYDQSQDEEAEACRAPEGGIAGRAGLLGEVGVGEAAGDEREEGQGRG